MGFAYSKKDYMLDEIPVEEETKEPDCKDTFPLDFSIYTFEHLSVRITQLTLNLSSSLLIVLIDFPWKYNIKLKNPWVAYIFVELGNTGLILITMETFGHSWLLKTYRVPVCAHLTHDIQFLFDQYFINKVRL